MRIALVGYGKMGKEIEKILDKKGHQISFRINKTNASDINLINPNNTDVAIEFTSPENGYRNVSILLAQGVKVVSGTTGWKDQLNEANMLCIEHKTTFLWASNFSIGVNIFFKVNDILAQIMSKHEEYIPSIEEIHHTAKKDAPSGTAITIAEGILAQYKTFKKWSLEQSSNELHINAIRRDPEPGTHIVTYQSDIDDITLSHVAKSRKGFALGAVMAAEYINDKIGIYTMNDVLFSK